MTNTPEQDAAQFEEVVDRLAAIARHHDVALTITVTPHTTDAEIEVSGYSDPNI